MKPSDPISRREALGRSGTALAALAFHNSALFAAGAVVVSGLRSLHALSESDNAAINIADTGIKACAACTPFRTWLMLSPGCQAPTLVWAQKS